MGDMWVTQPGQAAVIILLPCSAAAGALILLISDTAARVIFAPVEIPVGLIMYILGGLFFLYLITRGYGRYISSEHHHRVRRTSRSTAVPRFSATSASPRAPGKVVALLEPNGSGKSTLIKTLVGILPPAGGTVSINDTRVETIEPCQPGEAHRPCAAVLPLHALHHRF